MRHLIFLLALATSSSQNALPQNDKIVTDDFVGLLQETDEEAHDALQLVLDVFRRTDIQKHANREGYPRRKS